MAEKTSLPTPWTAPTRLARHLGAATSIAPSLYHLERILYWSRTPRLARCLPANKSQIQALQTGALLPPPLMRRATTRCLPRGRHRKEKRRQPWSCPPRNSAATTKSKRGGSLSMEGSRWRATSPDGLAPAVPMVVGAAAKEAASEPEDSPRYGGVEAEEVAGSVEKQISSEEGR